VRGYFSALERRDFAGAVRWVHPAWHDFTAMRERELRSLRLLLTGFYGVRRAGRVIFVEYEVEAWARYRGFSPASRIPGRAVAKSISSCWHRPTHRRLGSGGLWPLVRGRRPGRLTPAYEDSLGEVTMRENAIRRLFPRRALKIVIFGLVLLLLYGLAARSGCVVVERVELPLPGLPAELNGLTVVHFSDLHYGFGRFRSEESVAQITRLISSLQPDLIVFTGDLLDRAADPALVGTLPLQGLKAPLGVYAVMGNHDHHFGKEKIARSLADFGVEVLVNRSVRVEKGGRHFWLIGLDDPLTGDPDLGRAVASVPPGDFKILLVHTPDFAPHAASAGIQLQLSGHSHGGQVRLPGVGAMYCPPLGREYPLGLRQVPGSRTLVYTNRGLGTTVLPLRLFCPPEVTLLTLRSGSGN